MEYVDVHSLLQHFHCMNYAIVFTRILAMVILSWCLGICLGVCLSLCHVLVPIGTQMR